MLTKKEVSQMLNISVKTINKYMQLGKLKYYKLGDGIKARVRFNKEDVEEFIKRGK